MSGTVTQKKITEEDIREAERLELDARTIMRLVDLIFLFREDHNETPS